MAMEQARQGAERVTGIPNVTYDLVAVLHHKLDAIAAMEMYKKDAKDAGQPDAQAFFEECQRSDRAHIERLRNLLGENLQGSPPWTATAEGVVTATH